MPRLPGICEECGAIYPSALRAAASGEAPAFEVPAPCPVCGGSGRVPPEVLDRLGSLVRAAGVVGGDRERLGDVEDRFRDAAVEPGQSLDADAERIRRARLRARVDSDVGPDLVAALPGFRRGEVEAFLRLLRIAVELELAERPAGEAEGGRVDRMLEAAYDRHGADEAPGAGEPGPAERARRRLHAAGRNDPCPCGSGEKYKECHWVDDLRETR